jgi:hypothetical protein
VDLEIRPEEANRLDDILSPKIKDQLAEAYSQSPRRKRVKEPSWTMLLSDDFYIGATHRHAFNVRPRNDVKTCLV